MTENRGEFDNLLNQIGFGRWQAPIIVTNVLIIFQLPFHLVGSTFFMAPKEFLCHRSPPLYSLEGTVYNYSDSLGETKATFDSTCLSDPVEVTIDFESENSWANFTGLPSCPYIEYDSSIFKSTIVSEWHLVCDRSDMVPLFLMLYTVGSLIGSFISGPVGDKCGRKRAVVVGCFVNLLVVPVISFVPWLQVILFMRLVIGTMNMVVLLCAWNLALETTPSYVRSSVMMFLGLPYSVGILTLALLGYLIRTWYLLLLIGVIPYLVLLPITFWVDESPSWLIQRGFREEASKILENAVRRNKVETWIPVATMVNKMVETTSASASRRSPTEGKRTSERLVTILQQPFRYLRSPPMIVIFLLTPVLWFLQNCLYLSVAINANNFTSSVPFLYVALTGLMDGSAILIFTPLASRIDRKTIIFAGMFVGAVLFLLILLVPEDYFWIKWVLTMLGFLSVGGSFQVNFIYGPELFPTEIRARGFAFLNLMGSLGYIISPFVIEILAKYTWWAASVFFGCSGIIGSLIVLFLPETRNRALPESLEDVEDRWNKDRRRGKKKEDDDSAGKEVLNA